MQRILLGVLACLGSVCVYGQGVAEDKYFGKEHFERFTVGLCRVTQFNPYDLHFRCRSEEDFHSAHDTLLKERGLVFGGYSRDFRDLPEYISYWVKFFEPR